QGRTGNGRLIQKVTVLPHACDRLSAWVRTLNLRPASGVRLRGLWAAKGRQLTFHETSLKPTQDWTEVEGVFNSLEESAVNLYAGQWGGGAGTFWLDDLRLEELSLVNVLRRPGCPLTVASADGKTVYEEGRDFEPVRDPKLG